MVGWALDMKNKLFLSLLLLFLLKFVRFYIYTFFGHTDFMVKVRREFYEFYSNNQIFFILNGQNGPILV